MPVAYDAGQLRFFLTNRELEIERIRRRYRRTMHQLDGATGRKLERLERQRAKLNRLFLELQPAQHVQQLDPNELCARRILQRELDMMGYEGEPGDS